MPRDTVAGRNQCAGRTWGYAGHHQAWCRECTLTRALLTTQADELRNQNETFQERVPVLWITIEHGDTLRRSITRETGGIYHG